MSAEPLNPEVHVNPQTPISEIADLLRRMSTDTHEAVLEAYAMPSGLAAQVRLVPRDDIAPDFLRFRGDSFDTANDNPI